MSLGRVLAQQEAAILDAQIGQLGECKFLSESDVVELAAKCKVGVCRACTMRGGMHCMRLQLLAAAARFGMLLVVGRRADRPTAAAAMREGDRGGPRRRTTPNLNIQRRAPPDRRSCCSRSPT
jgi:hypothetical protein